MNISKDGIEHLKKEEGFRNHPYLCPAGVPTIGYGFTYYPNGIKVTLTDPPITKKKAEAILVLIVEPFEKWVEEKVKPSITQHQFDALVSFCYNIGKQAFEDSTLLKKVNNNPCDPSIENEFKRWVYADGKKSKGLKKRRNREAYLYFQ